MLFRSGRNELGFDKMLLIDRYFDLYLHDWEAWDLFIMCGTWNRRPYGEVKAMLERIEIMKDSYGKVTFPDIEWRHLHQTPRIPKEWFKPVSAAQMV